MTTNMADITQTSPFFYNVLEDYKRTTSFNSSRIKQDLTKEISTKSDYRGREIYELLQNAEDEKSDYVEICLDSQTRTLSVSNGGENCSPFTEEGFCSIMMAEMSPKLASRQTYIGCKGLGFRSLLNWAEEISIYSSGVICTFSSEIAQEYWDKEISSNLSSENAAMHVCFAKESLGLSCPVSILAIPHVKDNVIEDKTYTTKIEVKFKDDCEKSIIEQITSLSGMVLLFLKNIQLIKINLNGHESVIRKKSMGHDTICVYDSVNPDGIEYTLFKESGVYDASSNKIYEVCIAYDKKNHHKGNYLYTFFPTKVRIGLPCVIHATFDLNSSRNSLNETEANNWMQRKIASCLSQFVCSLTKESDTLSWEYLDLLNLNAFDQQDFPILNEEILKVKECLPIYPTIESGYCKLAETTHFSESFAKFQYDNSAIFPNHLIGGYTDYEISNDLGNREFLNRVNNFSRSILSSQSISNRADLIYAVSTVKNYFSPLFLLVDSNGDLIEKDGKINVGENIDYLPADMHVSYVHEDLIAALIDKFKIEANNPKRELTRLLRKCQIDVSDMDLNSAKKRIISYTKNEMSVEGFKQLVFALYRKIHVMEHSGLEKLFEDCDFRLLAKDQTKHYPSELVLSDDSIYRDNEVLLYDIEKWVDIFNQYECLLVSPRNTSIIANEDSVREFFYDTIHISKSIPLEFIPMDCHANTYLDAYSNTLWNSIRGYGYFYSANIEEKNAGSYNRFHVISRSFIERLSQEGKTLCEIIRYIMQDSRAIEELKKTTLYFQQRTVKSEIVEVSYPLFILRSYDLFKPLSLYIVSENIMLNGDNSMEMELLKLTKDINARQILLLLGARSGISDLSISELYNILETLPQRSLTRGVQKLYKSIREAINSKRSDSDFNALAENFRLNGTAYCRKDGGALEIKPISEIYYWDNEQLPHNILRTKYKLELPNRVGEDSVKAIFGVKLAKDIKIEIKESSENSILEHGINDRIQSRIRYFVAYRLQNSREINDVQDKKIKVDALRGIQIKVYSICSLRIDDSIVDLNEGDMVSTRNNGKLIFHVCSSLEDIASAIKTPTFCENITEAMCICLKVTSNEMANCFRSVLKNSMGENSFISKKEISLDIWEDVDKALGLSYEEQFFWEAVMRSSDKKLEKEQLLCSYSKKLSYLKSVFPNIVLPINYTEVTYLTPEEKYHLLISLAPYGIDSAEVLGQDGLSAFYKCWFDRQILNNKDSFTHMVYDYVTGKSIDLGNDSIPTKFYDLCMQFSSGEWLKGIETSLRYKILQECEMVSIFNAEFNKHFPGFSSLRVDYHWHPEPIETYRLILESYNLTTANLDQRELSYMFFQGYEKIFEDIVKKYVRTDTTSLDPGNSSADTSIEFSFGKGYNVANAKTNASTSNRLHGGRYSSDKEKHNAGLQAEQKVFNYLCSKKKLFANVSGCSRNLDPTNGNDGIHYDILYSPIENGETEHSRYLEVKSMSGDSIIMTAEEFQFAKDNAEFYDFAIVKGNSITIIKSPFLPDEYGHSLHPIPETYELFLEIRKL